MRWKRVADSTPSGQMRRYSPSSKSHPPPLGVPHRLRRLGVHHHRVVSACGVVQPDSRHPGAHGLEALDREHEAVFGLVDEVAPPLPPRVARLQDRCRLALAQRNEVGGQEGCSRQDRPDDEDRQDEPVKRDAPRLRRHDLAVRGHRVHGEDRRDEARHRERPLDVFGEVEEVAPGDVAHAEVGSEVVVELLGHVPQDEEGGRGEQRDEEELQEGPRHPAVEDPHADTSPRRRRKGRMSPVRTV